MIYCPRVRLMKPRAGDNIETTERDTMENEPSTEEIRAMLADEDGVMVSAAVAYCTAERAEMVETIEALRAELAERDQEAEDAFIEDLKAERKLAPKDEATEAALRSVYKENPAAARVMASKFASEKEREQENIAGGKTSDECNLSTEELMEKY